MLYWSRTQHFSLILLTALLPSPHHFIDIHALNHRCRRQMGQTIYEYIEHIYSLPSMGHIIASLLSNKYHYRVIDGSLCRITAEGRIASLLF